MIICKIKHIFHINRNVIKQRYKTSFVSRVKKSSAFEPNVCISPNANDQIAYFASQ